MTTDKLKFPYGDPSLTLEEERALLSDYMKNRYSFLDTSVGTGKDAFVCVVNLESDDLSEKVAIEVYRLLIGEIQDIFHAGDSDNTLPSNN